MEIHPLTWELQIFMRHLIVITRILPVAATILLTTAFSSAQFVGNNPQAVEKRVDDLVSKMTLMRRSISSAETLPSAHIPSHD